MAAVSTLKRGLDILDFVIRSEEPLKLADVIRHFGIDRAMAHRFLQTLCESGLLHQDPETKRYAMGAQFYAWMLIAHRGLAIVDVARPFLQDVAKRTDQSAHLGALIEDRVLLVDYVPSENLISVKNRVGVSEPLHCTAIGKSILMDMPAATRAKLLGKDALERFTERTILDRADLDRHLDAAAGSGYAFDNGEFNELLACVAVPLKTPRGLPPLAIGVSMLRPVVGGDPGAVARVAGELKTVARRLEARLSNVGVQAQIR
ncbi:MAG: IclR family transcriptional regulator [Proteobacteria bacterium]|nr:IclR family transcriptional regulator [Pseudomonadota bacterium]